MKSGSTDEFIEIYNRTGLDISLDGWKLSYFSAANKLGFSIPLNSNLMPRSYALATSTNNPPVGLTGDFSFSGGMAETGGHVAIIDNNGVEIDRLGWGSAVQPEGFIVPKVPSIRSLERCRDGTGDPIDTNNNSLDFFESDIAARGGGLYEDEVSEPEQPPEPPAEVAILPLVINELLPNPIVPQTDAEDEFVELFNPNNEAVNLKNYKLKTSSASAVVLPDASLDPGAYVVFLSKDKMVSLTNSGGTVKLLDKSDNELSSVDYFDVEEGQSYARFSDGWKWTLEPTPNLENILKLAIGDVDVPIKDDKETKDCRDDQFRNPETNRCKLKSAVGGDLQACAADQFRSLETNRCRKLSSASSTQTPCKIGQFRNPETNRCKSLASSSTAPKPCETGQERNPETKRCRKIAKSVSSSDPFRQVAVTDPLKDANWPVIGLIGGTTLLYGLYESRYDVRNQFQRARDYFRSRRETGRGP